MIHKNLKAKALSNPFVKAEYDALQPEFELLHKMLKARTRAGLTQADVAQRMGTKTPAVTRLESSSSTHSPSVKTLQRYAEAVGCRLEIRLIPQK